MYALYTLILTNPSSHLCDTFDTKWSKSIILILGVGSENLLMRISNTELICAGRSLIDQKYLIKSIYLFEGNEYQTSCLTAGLSQSNLLNCQQLHSESKISTDKIPNSALP